MKKKSAAKKKAAPKKKTRIEKLEVVVAELAIKLRDLETTLNELKKLCGSCCKPTSVEWPKYAPSVTPWYPIWHNVCQAVDYVSAIQNKHSGDKDKCNKHPGDRT